MGFPASSTRMLNEVGTAAHENVFVMELAVEVDVCLFRLEELVVVEIGCGEGLDDELGTDDVDCAGDVEEACAGDTGGLDPEGSAWGGVYAGLLADADAGALAEDDRLVVDVGAGEEEGPFTELEEDGAGRLEGGATAELLDAEDEGGAEEELLGGGDGGTTAELLTGVDVGTLVELLTGVDEGTSAELLAGELGGDTNVELLAGVDEDTTVELPAGELSKGTTAELLAVELAGGTLGELLGGRDGGATAELLDGGPGGGTSEEPLSGGEEVATAELLGGKLVGGKIAEVLDGGCEGATAELLSGREGSTPPELLTVGGTDRSMELPGDDDSEILAELDAAGDGILAEVVAGGGEGMFAKVVVRPTTIEVPKVEVSQDQSVMYDI
jgi:hypothetical protein